MVPQLNFLVAEDDENDRFFIERAFAEAGVEAALSFVRDGEEVIQYLSGDGQFADRDRFPYPDLLLLDINMRRIDGFRVLKWVRKRAARRSTPIIILSSSARDEDVERALDLGANCYLSKPCSLMQFIQVARSIDEFWVGCNLYPRRFEATNS